MSPCANCLIISAKSCKLEENEDDFFFCKKWRAEISYVTASCAVLVRWLHFFAFIQKKTKLLSKCQEYFLLMPLASVSCLHLKMVKFWVLLSPFTPQALFRPLGKILQSLLLTELSLSVIQYCCYFCFFCSFIPGLSRQPLLASCSTWVENDKLLDKTRCKIQFNLDLDELGWKL